MTYGTMKTRLLLACRNLKAAHPMVSNTNGGGDFVNAGMRFLVMRAGARFPYIELFPEHKDVDWTDVTIVDQNYLAYPTDQMIPQRVFSSDSSTSPNMNNTAWRKLGYVDPDAFDQLQKPTTDVAYPALYTFKEGRVYIHPTPRTTKTTYLKLTGVQDEPDMSSSSDSPRTNARWHEAIVACAAYLLMTDLGWHEDAAKQLNKADEFLNTATSYSGLRNADVQKNVRVAGMPRGN